VRIPTTSREKPRSTSWKKLLQKIHQTDNLISD